MRPKFQIPITRHMAIDPVGARARLEELLADPELTGVARNQLQIYLQQMGVSKPVDRTERIAQLVAALNSLADSPNNKAVRNTITVELIQLGWCSKPALEPEPEQEPCIVEPLHIATDGTLELPKRTRRAKKVSKKVSKK
jgi:hypothetical protein